MTDGAQASTSACAVALFVHTSSVRFGPDILDDEIPPAFKAIPQPRRPHPGGLDTLPETSHVNALSQATGPSPTSFSDPRANGTEASTQVDSILNSAMAALTPPSRSLTLARAKGYNHIAVQLTNERWRERWNRLCLAPVEQDESINDGDFDRGGLSKQQDNSIPSDGSTELRSGTSKLARSSSRKLLNDTHLLRATPTLQSIREDQTREGVSSVQREAEEWRRTPTFFPGEVNLVRYEDSEGVIAVISPWLELDSVDEGIRLDSELALRQELAYAAHLGIAQVILPPPSSDPASRPYLVDYARAIAGCIVSRGSEAPASGHFARLVIRIPIGNTRTMSYRSGAGRPVSVASNSSNGTAQLRSDDDWSWRAWHVIQDVCAYSPRLTVALDLSATLPPAGILERWFAEPVSHVWLPARVFLSNAKGYPVLSKACQSFLRSLIGVKAPNLCFLLVDTQIPPENHTRGGQAAYEQYVRHMERAVTSSMTESDVQARAYADYLQAPLQPLFDNLEGQTYATFESDSIKYEKYEEAICQALSTLSNAEPLTVWVCGAGRGPLVSRCIEAAHKATRTVHIIALEKNANAVVGLRERASHEWGENVVQVEMGDMRTVPVPERKADLIVTELLGSFGDNELSPECLDGAMRLLKPNGICIPRAYSSYVTPISTPKLYSEVSKGTPMQGTTENRIKATETPYVVLLRAVNHIAAQGGRDDWSDVQHCWTFDHSSPANVPVTQVGLPITNGHNVRMSSHTFYIPRQSLCHGLAGFFEAHLYGDVVLSIHPDPARTTKGMMSWFPFFFPFRTPLFLAPEAELDVSLWRMTSGTRVWYEWMAQAFVVTGRPTRATSVELGSGESSGSHPFASKVPSQVQQQGARNGPVRFEAQDAGASNSHPDAFQNAPPTPRFSDGVAAPYVLTEAPNVERILVGMTSLMNPGGRSSSVHM